MAIVQLAWPSSEDLLGTTELSGFYGHRQVFGYYNYLELDCLNSHVYYIYIQNQISYHFLLNIFEDMALF